jgi:hypothetical protein
MANLTRAERHNKNLNKVFDTYREQQNKLPPAQLYSRFLEIAKEKLLISIEEARAKYGLYTVMQWETLLKLGWNKN